MKIHALLSWYDEPDEWLTRTILSIAPLVDHVIALDGKYARFPGTEYASPESNREAIRRACRDAELDLTLGPAQEWATQCEKRTELFRLAEEAGTIFDDWLLIIDADEYAIQMNPDALKHALSTTRSHTCMIGWTILEYDIPPEELELQRCDVNARRQRFNQRGIPRLFRLLPNMQVGPNHHWLYTADGRRGQRVALKGKQLAPHLKSYTPTSVKPHITIASDTLARDLNRKQVKAAYYDERKIHGEDL